MSRKHLMACLLVLGMTAGCKAQPAPQASNDLQQNRRIEVLVRSQFNVPQDIDVSIGTRSSSPVNGFQALPVTLSHGGRKQVINFLISDDGNTLARLDTYDLANNPLFSIDTFGRPIRGDLKAKVTVINFDDLECPFCARMHQTLFPGTLEHYKGLVRFVYKDDPLMEIHPWALRAAVDANCLAAQNTDVYWSYVDYLHAHGQEINGTDRNPAKSFDALDRVAREQAKEAKWDAEKLAHLDTCLAKQDEAPVRASAKEAEALGVDGTPALFIDGERINGALPEAQVWMVIDRALRAKGIQPPAATPAPVATK